MKAKLLLILLAMCLLSSGGCALSYNLLRTTVVQPKQFCSYWDKKHQQKYFRKVARQELERARATARAESDDYTCDPYSQDEVCGFEDGFVDYVMYGGNGNPPPLPPRRYWKSKSPNGYEAIQDWYNGFRHGASVAQASGYRDCVTIQLSDGLNTKTLPTYIGQRSGIGYIDSYGPLLSEKNAQEPASSLSGKPDLATSLEESDEAWPIPKANFPAEEKPKLEAVHFPIIKSPTSPSIYPDNRVGPRIASAQSDQELPDPEKNSPSAVKPKPEAVHFPIIKSPASPSVYPDNRVEPRISSAQSDQELPDPEKSSPSAVKPKLEAVHYPIITAPTSPSIFPDNRVEPRIASAQSDQELPDPEKSSPSAVKPKPEAVHFPIIKSPASPSIYPDNRVEPRISSAQSDQVSTDSETSLPTDVKPKPEAVHFPIIKSPASPSIYRDNHVVPLSQSWPRFSNGVDPSSPTGAASPTGVKLASASEPESPPSSASPIATQFSFESLPPLSASPNLPGENRPVSIPATQAAPIKRLPAKSESSLFEPQSSSASEGEHALISWLAPVSEIEADASQTSLPGVEPVPAEKASFNKSKSRSDAEVLEGASQPKILDDTSGQKSGVQRLWPIMAGVALFVAGIIYLVRRRPRTAALALSRLRQLYHRMWRLRWPRPESRLPTMPATHQEEYNVRTQGRVSTRAKVGMMIAMMGCLMSGCASLTNPVLNGIPVRKLPTELLSSPNRDRLQTVPLSLLRQKQPEDYVLAAGDVIGVFVAGVFPLTSPDQPLPTPPVYFPSQIDPLGAGLPPSLGYPVTIRNDGTLSLPLVDPIMVDGLTLEAANSQIREAYLDKGILQPGREAVLVTLMQRRQIRVLVFRQEVGGFSAGGRGDISGNNVKQGTGHLVDLRAYENDVVTALANTGGLPGLDAFDGVFIFRGGQSNAVLVETLPSLEPGEQLESLSELGVVVDYIPTRWPKGEPLPFEPEDAILHEGDVVLLESRVTDFFYTGGLLPSGQQVLPRDYDLDVVEAVAQVNGTLVNGAFGGNNFNGLLIQQGIGNPNPSALTVIRRTPDGGQIPISVDLNRALVDARERILIRPNDVLILQETGWEAIARYFGNAINFSVTIFDSGDGAATAVQGN